MNVIKKLIYSNRTVNWIDLQTALLLSITQHYKIKTHGTVSCSPRKWGTYKWSEFIVRNSKAVIFTRDALIVTDLMSVRDPCQT